ncbi:hypothetical protein GCM10023405_35230 [Streptomonospora salina]
MAGFGQFFRAPQDGRGRINRRARRPAPRRDARWTEGPDCTCAPDVSTPSAFALRAADLSGTAQADAGRRAVGPRTAGESGSRGARGSRRRSERIRPRFRETGTSDGLPIRRGAVMEVTGIFTAIIIGLIIGVLARIILPGKQNIQVWLTILVGIVAALVGTAIAGFAGYADTPGIDWWELITQVVLAVAGVGLVSGMRSGKGS